LDVCSSRYDSFTEPLKREFVQRIHIYLSNVYIILDSTELHFLCFENRWQPEEVEAVAGAMEVMQMFMQHMQNTPLQEDRHLFM
jgi:hypothetical protein